MNCSGAVVRLAGRKKEFLKEKTIKTCLQDLSSLKCEGGSAVRELLDRVSSRKSSAFCVLLLDVGYHYWGSSSNEYIQRNVKTQSNKGQEQNNQSIKTHSKVTADLLSSLILLFFPVQFLKAQQLHTKNSVCGSKQHNSVFYHAAALHS